MEKELFFSGYCRALDGSRTVEVIVENGIVTEVDCAWPNCIPRASCPIAKQIDELTEYAPPPEDLLRGCFIGTRNYRLAAQPPKLPPGGSCPSAHTGAEEEFGQKSNGR